MSRLVLILSVDIALEPATPLETSHQQALNKTDSKLPRNNCWLEANFSKMYDVPMQCGYQGGKLLDIYQAEQIEPYLMPCSCSCCNTEWCINVPLLFILAKLTKLMPMYWLVHWASKNDLRYSFLGFYWRLGSFKMCNQCQCFIFWAICTAQRYSSSQVDSFHPTFRFETSKLF